MTVSARVLTAPPRRARTVAAHQARAARPGVAGLDHAALLRADHGSRTRAVLELQRSGGNAAVVARLQPTLQRRKPAPKSAPKVKQPAFDRAELEAIKFNAEYRHIKITNFIRASRTKLQEYKSRLLSAAAVYKVAFGRHKSVLDKAETAAKDRSSLISNIAGFATGVVLGAPGSLTRLGLKALADRSGTLFAIGSEIVEMAVGKGAGAAAGGPEAGAFDPTAVIPEVKELEIWRTLAETNDPLLTVSLLTEKLVKIVSASGTAIAEVRLREGGAKNLEKSDADLTKLVAALREADQSSAAVDAALIGASAEIDALGAERPKSMSVDEVEQDLWIEWIADLTDDDLLDEDDITDRLEELGVIGEGRRDYDENGNAYTVPPRLNVDFGHWVSDDDEKEAVEAARAKLGRARPEVRTDGYYDDE